MGYMCIGYIYYRKNGIAHIVFFVILSPAKSTALCFEYNLLFLPLSPSYCHLYHHCAKIIPVFMSYIKSIQYTTFWCFFLRTL